MYTLELNEAQMKNLLELLDSKLKSDGLMALPLVVDLHNVIASAKLKVEPVVQQEEVKVEETNEG